MHHSVFEKNIDFPECHNFPVTTIKLIIYTKYLKKKTSINLQGTSASKHEYPNICKYVNATKALEGN